MGFYLDGTVCGICNETCPTCIENGVCDSCLDGYEFTDSSTNANQDTFCVSICDLELQTWNSENQACDNFACLSHQYLLDNECFKCSDGCATCPSFQECSTCIPGYEWYDTFDRGYTESYCEPLCNFTI